MSKRKWPRRIKIQDVEGYGLYLPREEAEREDCAPERIYQLVPLRKRRAKRKGK